jgi:hypothetical protein
MKSTMIWALGALNVLLLAAFVGQVTRPNSAVAQAGGRPGDYIMLPGEVNGGSGAVVYIVDTSNAQLSAMTLDPNAKGLVAMPPIDLARVFNENRGGAGAAGGRGARE